MSENICTRCKSEEGDLRTLYHACLYQMEELGIPFDQVIIADRTFYTIRVCKICRAEWLTSIKRWFDIPLIKIENHTGVYIRKLGGTFEATPEEVVALIEEKKSL